MTRKVFNQRRREHRYVVSRPRRREDEEIVQNGLSVTPAQMLEMSEHNIPITPSNLGVTFDEGYSDLDFEPPAMYRRGVDLGDAWELEQSSKDKFRKLRNDGKFVASSNE